MQAVELFMNEKTVTGSPAQRLRNFFALPVRDYFAALNVFKDNFRISAVVALVALVLSWWVYVPVHEIFHAVGCLLGGGEVSRLDIKPVYGAVLLGKVFPFVHSGSEYAGRLSGFDTHGSDLTYLLTVFFPYLLTIFIGVPLLKSIPHVLRAPLSGALKLGLSIPIAYAPFISITGDYYVKGSLGTLFLIMLFIGTTPLCPFDILHQ